MILSLANLTPSIGSLAFPATTSNAAAFKTTKFSTGLAVDNSLLKRDRSVAAFSVALPPLTLDSGWVERPKSAGDIVFSVMIPFSRLQTCYTTKQKRRFSKDQMVQDGVPTFVGPAGLISSKPSSPQTTHARSTPVILSPSANMGPRYLEWTPTIIACGLAGLINGPKALKTVGNPRAFRTGATRTMAGW